MDSFFDLILECQDCGTVLKQLEPSESQKVASNPERYIIFCGPCGSARLEELKKELGY
ncbi:MAG TPA: hypothetical protein VIY48_04015 [Candidatus Paceibacterota bacterium]